MTVIVACLLLPTVTVLLYGMDRVEDWLTRTPRRPRHAHTRSRHLRLVQGGEGGARNPFTRPHQGRRSSDAA